MRDLHAQLSDSRPLRGKSVVDVTPRGIASRILLRRKGVSLCGSVEPRETLRKRPNHYVGGQEILRSTARLYRLFAWVATFAIFSSVDMVPTLLLQDTPTSSAQTTRCVGASQARLTVRGSEITPPRVANRCCRRTGDSVRRPNPKLKSVHRACKR
jgi:hypothetical protein